MYSSNAFDIAGFAVGAYEKMRDTPLPMKDDVIPGDVIIGISSTGLHSNGYSLARKVVQESGLTYNDAAPFDSNKSIGESQIYK